MLRLINNELKKIFHKKGIYIVLCLMVGFCFLNNLLYFLQYDEKGNYKDISREEDNHELQKLKKEWEQSKDQPTVDVVLKSKIDILEWKKEFAVTSWQYQKMEDYLYDLAYQKNYYTYLLEDRAQLEEISELLAERLQNLRNNNSKYFWLQEKEALEEEVVHLQESLSDEEVGLNVAQIQKNMNERKLEIQVLNYRIKNLVYEDNTYLDVALKDYLTTEKQLSTDTFKKELSHSNKLLYRELLRKNKRSQYILQTKKNIDQENTLNYQLRTILEDYEIFLVVLVLMVSVVLVCDEFRSGTVKLLLIKPYSRFIILLSKYFTTLIVFLFGIIVLILAQILFGGILFGFDSLQETVVVYQFDQARLVTYPVFSYMMIRIGARIPFYLQFSLISFGMGVATANMALSILIPFIFYLFGPTLQELAILHHLKFMKYLVNLNWNFQDYLFGGISKLSGLNFTFSFVVWLCYFIVFFLVTFGIFQKKDIKNI